ncbi:MAG: GntR family transcriptional regulator [Pseudomonadota bacterium]
MNEISQPSVLKKNSESDESTRTITSEFYQKLRGDILSGGLAPRSKLRIEGLAEKYEVGATPVREALSRLWAEGFVEKREQRGFNVADVSLKEIKSLTRTRCWLEEIALRESMRNRTDAWEENVLVAYHRMSRVPRLASTTPPVPAAAADILHWNFHDLLLANCDSPSLLGYCKDLREKCERYRSLAASTIYKPDRDTLKEHEMILKPVLDGDIDTAVDALVTHYNITLKQIEIYFANIQQSED